MSELLSRIASAHDQAPLRAVEVPEWGTVLYFRPLTPHERAQIRRGVDPKDEEELVIATLILKALDKDGNRVFGDDARTRATLIGKADMTVVARILSEASAKPETVDSARKN